MNLLSKETLIGAVSLGAGAVTAKVVQNKVLPLAKMEILTNPNVANLITLGIGVFFPIAIKSTISKGFGAGMIAVSVAGLVEPLLQKAGIAGTGDVFLGDVPTEQSGTLMGAVDTFSSAGDDSNSGASGEMDY